MANVQELPATELAGVQGGLFWVVFVVASAAVVGGGFLAGYSYGSMPRGY